MLKWLSSMAKGNRRDEKRSSKKKKPKRSNEDNLVRISRGEHGISRKDIDEHALKVLYRLRKSGFHACLVGGAVRDLLLGVKPKDFDVATDATPEEVNKLFRNCRLIGRRFRLAHIHFGRTIIEVATFRADHDDTQEGHQDSAGKIVRDNVYGDIGQDVWRRDFTANALYYDIEDFSVLDYVDGWQDIHDKRLRLIGDVETRLREDPVRMIRAVRFAAKLDFTIDDEVQDGMHRLGHLLQDVHSARMYEETLKLFHSGHAVKSFQGLREFGLLRYLFPETDKAISEDESVVEFIELALKSTDTRIRNNAPVTPAFLFAALLWEPLQKRVKRDVDTGVPYAMAMQQSISEVIGVQIQSLSIPKRFTTVMRDIWSMQGRFRYRKGRRAESLLAHPKFRAAYDLLCLRAKAGEDVQEDCDWWTDIQKQSDDERHKQMKPRRSHGGKKQSGRGRRRRPPRDRK